jgi:hypothetical protein
MSIQRSTILGSIAISTALLLAGCASNPGTPTATGDPASTPTQVNSPGSTPITEKAVLKTLPPIILRPYVIPEGTELSVRTTNTLSTKTAQAGQAFTGSLDTPLIIDGDTIARKGADVTGSIVASDDGGRVEGVAHITVRLTSLQLDNGKTLDIETSAYRKNAKKTVKKDAVKVGIASGIGAAIGAIAGGGKGAAIGAGAGAGAGTGVVLATHGQPAVIAPESLLRFKLTSTVEVSR